MSVYDLALKMESDGEKYYKEQAEKVNNDSLEEVFNILAGEENKHYNIVKKMMKDEPIKSDDLKSEVKTIFNGKSFKKEEYMAEADQIHVYRHALVTEQESVTFYENLKKDAKDDNEKKVFDALITEEKSHVNLFENIIELLLRPSDWVESAEFNIVEIY